MQQIIKSYPENVLVKVFGSNALEFDIDNFDSNVRKVFQDAGIIDRDVEIFDKKYKNGMTLAELGEEYNLTREAVRLVLRRILNKISSYEYRGYFINGEKGIINTYVVDTVAIPDDIALDNDVHTLNLTNRAYNRLAVANIKTIGELKDFAESDFGGEAGRKFKVGFKTIKEIQDKLQEIGLTKTASPKIEKKLRRIMRQHGLSKEALLNLVSNL